jgi:hypothetical protein
MAEENDDKLSGGNGENNSTSDAGGGGAAAGPTEVKILELPALSSEIKKIDGLDPDFFDSSYNVIFPVGNRRLSSKLAKLDLSQYIDRNPTDSSISYTWQEKPSMYTGFGNLNVYGPAIFGTNDKGELDIHRNGQKVTYNYNKDNKERNTYTTYLYTEYEGKIHIFKVVEYILGTNRNVTLKPIDGENSNTQAIIFTLENINNTRFEINSKNKDKITFKILYKELCNANLDSDKGTRINLYTDNFIGEFKVKYVLDEKDSFDGNRLKRGKSIDRTKKYKVVFYSTEYYVNGIDKLNVYTSPNFPLSININQPDPIQVESENTTKISTDKRQFILELARELYLASGFDSYPEKTPASFAKDAINRATIFYNVAKSSKVEEVTDPYDNIKTSIYLI